MKNVHLNSGKETISTFPNPAKTLKKKKKKKKRKRERKEHRILKVKEKL